MALDLLDLYIEYISIYLCGSLTNGYFLCFCKVTNMFCTCSEIIKGMCSLQKSS